MSEVPEKKPKARKWPERLLLAAAVLLLVAGAWTMAFHWLGLEARQGITGEVLAGLEEAERIEASSGDLRGFNVLVITTDTTRADHIGAYGNTSVKTPVIDGLARDGILFSQTTTPSPSTLPAGDHR